MNRWRALGTVFALALVFASVSWAGGDEVPLSRVLLTETDLRASISKVALARYYLGRSLEAPARADGDRAELAGRAAQSLKAAAFYLGSSLAFSRGELRRDLEALQAETRRLEARLGREPPEDPEAPGVSDALEALKALEALEGRLQEVLASIDRSGRTYKGSAGWVPSWTTDGLEPAP